MEMTLSRSSRKAARSAKCHPGGTADAEGALEVIGQWIQTDMPEVIIRRSKCPGVVVDSIVDAAIMLGSQAGALSSADNCLHALYHNNA